MKRFRLLALSALCCVAARGEQPDFSLLIRPVPATAKFTESGYEVWCGTMIRSKDGRYHLFYSRWPAKAGHDAWVTHSEIAHAVGDSPFGAFRAVDVALPRRGKAFWDGLCTHNPTVHEFGGKYYLYYMGDTGDIGDGATPAAVAKSFWTHRNNQRVGVAVADSPDGPWTRADKPLIETSADPDASDALCVNNPSVLRRADGKYVLVYKAVAKRNKLPFGGPVSHRVALADSPTGPFVKVPGEIFTLPGAAFPAEDPFIWAQDGGYYAIVRDFRGAFNGTGRNSLSLFVSEDAVKWRVADNPLVSVPRIPWERGAADVYRMERPQLYLENGGPVAFLCAVSETPAMKGTYNVRIPLASERGKNAGKPNTASPHHGQKDAPL